MNITVPAYEQVGGHFEYQLRVIAETGTWQFRKRYSLLRRFHEELHHICSSLPLFPPKKMFGNTKPQFLEKRRSALDDYFSRLCDLPSVRKSEIFGGFIKPKDAVILAGAAKREEAASPSHKLPTLFSQERAGHKAAAMNQVASEVAETFLDLSCVPSPLDREDVALKRQKYTRVLTRADLHLQWAGAFPTSDGSSNVDLTTTLSWLDTHSQALAECFQPCEMRDVLTFL
jgi:hypothetical protein